MPVAERRRRHLHRRPWKVARDLSVAAEQGVWFAPRQGVGLMRANDIRWQRCDEAKAWKVGGAGGQQRFTSEATLTRSKSGWVQDSWPIPEQPSTTTKAHCVSVIPATTRTTNPANYIPRAQPDLDRHGGATAGAGPRPV